MDQGLHLHAYEIITEVDGVGSGRETETGHGVEVGFLHFAGVFCYRIQRDLGILGLHLDFQVVIKLCLPNKEDRTYFIYLTVCQMYFKPSNI